MKKNFEINKYSVKHKKHQDSMLYAKNKIIN